LAIKLNKREQYFVSAAIAVVVVFTVIHLIVLPLLAKRNQLKRTVRVKIEQLQTMRALSAEYQLLSEQSESAKIRLANREAGFSLFSYLDELVGKTGLKDRISYMKPSTSEGPDKHYKISTVEMKLQGLTLERLVQYLYHLEKSGKSVQIKRISITETGKSEGLVDVVLQVETLESV
jgi:general secretion pathway protein M